jgi:hypothetical protein
MNLEAIQMWEVRISKNPKIIISQSLEEIDRAYKEIRPKEMIWEIFIKWKIYIKITIMRTIIICNKMRLAQVKLKIQMIINNNLLNK